MIVDHVMLLNCDYTVSFKKLGCIDSSDVQHFTDRKTLLFFALLGYSLDISREHLSYPNIFIYGLATNLSKKQKKNFFQQDHHI